MYVRVTINSLVCRWKKRIKNQWALWKTFSCKLWTKVRERFSSISKLTSHNVKEGKLVRLNWRKDQKALKSFRKRTFKKRKRCRKCSMKRKSSIQSKCKNKLTKSGSLRSRFRWCKRTKLIGPMVLPCRCSLLQLASSRMSKLWTKISTQNTQPTIPTSQQQILITKKTPCTKTTTC